MTHAEMARRHMGHGSPSRKGCAQAEHTHRCPHGWKMTPGPSAQHTTHSPSSTSGRSVTAGLTSGKLPASSITGLLTLLAAVQRVLAASTSSTACVTRHGAAAACFVPGSGPGPRLSAASLVASLVCTVCCWTTACTCEPCSASICTALE